MAKSRQRPPPEICPVCGDSVPPRAAACPGCGADHATGWDAEQTRYDGLDLPDDEFDYDEFIAREFGARGGRRPRRRRVWVVAVAIVAAAFLYLALSALWR